MIASYLLSRTVVPTLVMLLMGGEMRPLAPAMPTPPPEGVESSGRATSTRGAHEAAPKGLLAKLYRAFDSRFERVRRAYTLVLSAMLAHLRGFAPTFLGFCLASLLLVPVLGRDFFPSVDAGQIRLHFRAPTGTRIEETARIADAVEAAIRELIPARELETVLDNLGIPNSGINLSYSNAGTIGTLGGDWAAEAVRTLVR
jgi:multidrug efflux pump subunit AcrB